MNQKVQMSRLLPVIFFYCSFIFHFSAQAPTVNCPALPVVLDDVSDNDNNFWNANWWWDPLILSKNLGETPATPLTITGTDHCSTSGNLSFRYVLSLDLDKDNVFETFIDSDSLPNKNIVYVGNKINNLFSGTAKAFDSRQVTADLKWGFDIAVAADGANRKAQIVWKNNQGQTTPAELPHGNHRIQWFVTDSCGATTVCAYNFTIRDGKKPDVVCLNGLSVNLMNMNGGLIQLWASDFLQYTLDNFTPPDQLKIGIRRSGTGTGFPFNPDGTPQTSVLFNCNDLGTQLVELWSIDKSGNADFCETYVLIQDNQFVCNSEPPQIGGRITTEIGNGIQGVYIDLNSNQNGVPWFSTQITTDSFGFYLQNNALPISTLTNITPILDIDLLNGVNAWDLVLISRHILGVEPINSPYKLISADVNKSGTVTTFDVVELRKLILGTYTEFPNNTSWRFIDKLQNFANPANPFADVIRENITFNPNYSPDFIGCKIGDIDLTAIPNLQGDAVEDRYAQTAFIDLINAKVSAGQTFTIHINAPHDIEGLQMTVATKGLQLNKIIPGCGTSNDNFARFPGNMFTAVIEKENAAFDVQFTALTNGDLEDMLGINSDITPAVCFGKNGFSQSLALRFADEIQRGDVPVLYAPTPNPWKESTQIGFYLPEDSDVQLSVVDANGAVVKTISQYFTAGEQQVRLVKSEFPQAGMYYVRIRAGDFVAVKKMVLEK